ncbi:MAG: ArsR/SmtB family transcription factor [Acidimicrobiales bacterium]
MSLVARLQDSACCPPLGDTALTESESETAAAIFAVLSDPVRLRLLSLIANQPDGACGCELVDVLGRSQPTVSHHLKVLNEAGLLDRERRGRWIWYTVADGSLRAVRELLAL